jgi:hypothetical protein
MSKHPLTIPSPTAKSNAGTSRSKPPASGPAPIHIELARRHIAHYVEHANTVRINSAIGYITHPLDKLLGKEKAIFAVRDQKT